MIPATRKNKQTAFTIVELVVVISVIAILASIIVVSYSSVTRNARVVALKADLTAASSKLIKEKSQKGSFPATQSDAAGAGVLVASGGVTFEYSYYAGAGSFCLTGSNQNDTYYITSGKTEPIKGGCPGHTDSEQATIVNIAANPSFELSDAGATLEFDGTPDSSTLNRDNSPVEGTYAAEGTWYLRLWVPGGTGYPSIKLYVGAAEANTQYTCSVMVRATNNRPINISLGATNASGSYISWSGHPTASTASGSDGSWERESMTFTTPAATEDLWMYIHSGNYHGEFDVDGLVCVAGATIYPYRDGSSTNWTWQGASNESPSFGPRP